MDSELTPLADIKAFIQKRRLPKKLQDKSYEEIKGIIIRGFQKHGIPGEAEKFEEIIESHRDEISARIAYHLLTNPNMDGDARLKCLTPVIAEVINNNKCSV